ncbi:MAG TPA: triose-phosphate isomerase [Acidimicrobiales bacterium]|nr:triose-phosphate isomerase [Acidimicrobiales bacterium]
MNAVDQSLGSAAEVRRPLVSGNWKMHHDHLEAIRTVQELGLRIQASDVEIVDVTVHPPFTDLRSVQTVLEDRSIPVSLGAQHCNDHDSGAFTGEISPPMLSRLGVRFVIVGHSERRQLFGETDLEVRSRARAVQNHGMTPIVCVGETDEERSRGLTLDRLESQVTFAFEGLDREKLARCVVAYEPIWAIGTGNTATPDDAQQACAHIRGILAVLGGLDAASIVRIQYGGSVKPENAAELISCPDVDGFLVGGASLDASSFASIVNATASALVPAKGRSSR